MHLDFTDYRPFLDQLGGVAGFPPELFGPLDGVRAVETTCAYVRAFFDVPCAAMNRARSTAGPRRRGLGRGPRGQPVEMGVEIALAR